MVEGNSSELVRLSKTNLLIERGFGLTVPQLASKHGLSNSQMTMALEDAGIIKPKVKEGEEVESKELTAREQKFIDVCAEYEVMEDQLTEILGKLGLEYKTGRRISKGGKKFIIIDDFKNEA